MKIIGKSDEGFIVDIGEDEIARLIGYYYYSLSTDGKTCPKLKIGDILNINEMYLQLYKISKNQETLDNISKELLEYSNLLKQIQPIVNSNL